MKKRSDSTISVQLLGQSGCKICFPGVTIYLDPYLSNSVQELDAPDLDRLLSIPILPENVNDADFVFVTHDHIDHCDPHTLPGLAQASLQSKFVAPLPVIKLLAEWGIDESRLQLCHEKWEQLSPKLTFRAVPAAHPTISRDENGLLSSVGFLFEYNDKRIYYAGDTSVTEELITSLKQYGQIDLAFLPVNEHNFFRDRRNILGNMTVREAFLLAEELNIRQVVPVHWDMFAANAVYPEEIQAIYTHMKPAFQLLMNPKYV